MRILVTGGRGHLGRELVPRLQQAGHTVRIMSRGQPAAVPTPPQPALVAAGPAPTSAPTPPLEWATAALATGEGLTAAVADVDAVIHAASSPIKARAVDVDGTRRLLDAARAAGVAHFVYVSIVGVDRHPWDYYQQKYAAERLLEAGGVPYSILRATQFHYFVDLLLQTLGRLPVLFVPAGFQFQPVDIGEVADRLLAAVADGPGGRLPDFGGPEVRRVEDLARSWARSRGRRGPIVPVPLPGASAAAFRQGVHTCPDHATGKITWEEYLRCAR